MRIKNALRRVVAVVGLGALAMETLWLLAEIAYRVYLANTYHWEKYANHVDGSFFDDMFVLYGVSLVTAFALTRLPSRNIQKISLATTGVNTLSVVTLILLWSGKYLVTYEQFIGQGRGW